MTKIYKFIFSAALMLQSLGTYANEPIVGDTVQLHDVLIEASKAGFKFKRLPASVSVLTNEEILRTGLQSVPSLSLVMPNLFMGDYGSKLTSPVYVRGIGSRINAPSVGLYVDHVPYYEKAVMNFDLYDISRIELLRGPQGTEYGRNTMGGIINIRTKSPIDYQGLDVRMQAATYGDHLASVGYYAHPVESFAYSLSAHAIRRDGFFRNEHLNKPIDRMKSYGMRNRLNYLPSSSLSLENIFSLEHSDQGGYAYTPYDAKSKKLAPIAHSDESGYERTMLSDALVLKYRKAGKELISTTSYQFFKDKQYIDQDFSPVRAVYVVQRQKQHLVAQDISLRLSPTERLSLLMGLNGFYQYFDMNVKVDRIAQKVADIKYNKHGVAGGALYLQATAKDLLFSGLNLTAGLRLDAERDMLDFRHDAEAAGKTNTKTDKRFDPLSSIELLPKLALGYQFGQHSAYATVARGYKTGGFNTSFETIADITFGPEQSWNYEIGLKSAWLGKRIFSELSFFFIDWSNQQIYRPVSTGGAMLVNAGHSQSRGLELSLRTAPLYGFELIGAYGLTDAKFVDNKRDAKTDYTGNRLPYAPQNTVSLELRKSIDLGQRSPIRALHLSAQYKGAGKIYYDEANVLVQDYYSLLSARVSLEHSLVRLDLWGENLTNTHYLAHYFALQMGKARRGFAQAGRPLQLGATLSFSL
ncbi:MAG: TonB-dependent receptor [Porphyromonadaceae bacterium]|nr:TonB-dependent receptor [Porphyromonadaceae bacterium]